MDPKRPLSWSAIASFRYDPEQWYAKYVLGHREPENEAMRFGKWVGEMISKDPTFLPEVPRFKEFEKKLEGKIGKIRLIGFLDSFDPVTKAYKEYKTSANKTKWTKKSSQDHGQLLMYKFLLWTNYGVDPGLVDSELCYIPVRESGSFTLELTNEPVKIFNVKHTASDVLKFAQYIKDTYAEMEAFALAKSIASSKIDTSIKVGSIDNLKR